MVWRYGIYWPSTASLALVTARSTPEFRCCEFTQPPTHDSWMWADGSKNKSSNWTDYTEPPSSLTGSVAFTVAVELPSLVTENNIQYDNGAFICYYKLNFKANKNLISQAAKNPSIWPRSWMLSFSTLQLCEHSILPTSSALFCCMAMRQRPGRSLCGLSFTPSCCSLSWRLEHSWSICTSVELGTWYS